MSEMLLDTNILVYALVQGVERPAWDAEKAATAKRVFEQSMLSGEGVVCLQNLAELSRVCLTKVRPAPTVAQVLTMVDDVASVFRVLVPGKGTVQSALQGIERHSLSLWDAMIWAVAREHGIDEIVTEDTPPGRVLEGIRYTNPFRS